jgi:hypothetical protein
VEKIIVAGLIFPIKEVEWISPTVIHRKKDTKEIWVCVDYISLNSACVHDPFSTPFSDKVVDQVSRKESHSFTNGFSKYHQVRIKEEEKK